jgi:RNA recognition motif-containing protein
MKNKYEIISHFLFPKFTQAKESRFINFFSSLSYKKKYNNHLNQYSISLEKIENGEDKRTSVIIKNIPNTLNKENIKQILEGVGNINYLYLPFDKVMNRNLGFAFINVVNYKNIINLYKRLKEYKFENNEFKNNIEINYSKVQGKNNLSNMFAKK